MGSLRSRLALIEAAVQSNLWDRIQEAAQGPPWMCILGWRGHQGQSRSAAVVLIPGLFEVVSVRGWFMLALEVRSWLKSTAVLVWVWGIHGLTPATSRVVDNLIRPYLFSQPGLKTEGFTMCTSSRLILCAGRERSTQPEKVHTAVCSTAGTRT